MIRDMDHAPIRLLVINSEIVALRIAREQRKKIGDLTKSSDVNALFFGKLEHGPERVRICFSHRIVETQIRGSGSTRSGPVPVPAWNWTTIVERHLAFENASARSQSQDYLPLH